MTTFSVACLDASRPADYLAAVGLAHLTPNARLSFDETVPALRTDTDVGEVVEIVATSVEHLTAPDAFPLANEEQYRTTTPTWRALFDPSTRSWADPAIDAVLRTFDVGGVGAGEKPSTHEDIKVSSASLVLISGRSYLRKSLAELWPAPPGSKDVVGAREQQRAGLREDLAHLLAGGSPSALRGPMGMRFTVADPSPRLRSGTEIAVLYPLVEALAFAGTVLLLPRQLGHPADDPGRRRPGLTWTLNPVPLSPAAVIAIHEQQAAPLDWPQYTAVTRTVGGGTKASHFTDIRALEAP